MTLARECVGVFRRSGVRAVGGGDRSGRLGERGGGQTLIPE